MGAASKSGEGLKHQGWKQVTRVSWSSTRPLGPLEVADQLGESTCMVQQQGPFVPSSIRNQDINKYKKCRFLKAVIHYEYLLYAEHGSEMVAIRLDVWDTVQKMSKAKCYWLPFCGQMLR